MALPPTRERGVSERAVAEGGRRAEPTPHVARGLVVSEAGPPTGQADAAPSRETGALQAHESCHCGFDP
jgi:hypothetical protein